MRPRAGPCACPRTRRRAWRTSPTRSPPSCPRRRPSRSSPSPTRPAASAFFSLFAFDLQDGEERLLWDLDAADLLHALLAGLLLLQQLPLARDVAAVALGEHVLAQRLHALARDDVGADRGLHRDVEHLP